MKSHVTWKSYNIYKITLQSIAHADYADFECIVLIIYTIHSRNEIIAAHTWYGYYDLDNNKLPDHNMMKQIAFELLAD